MSLFVEDYSNLLIIQLLYKIAVVLTLFRFLLSWALNHTTTPSSSSSNTTSSSSSLASSQMIKDSLVLASFGDVSLSATDTCSICLAQMKDQDLVRELRNCCHVFHKECIDKWIDYEHDQNCKSCPLCRAPLLSKSCSSNWVRNEPSWAVERILYLFGDDLLM